MLLIATRMSACAFKRFGDLILTNIMKGYDDNQKSAKLVLYLKLPR